MFFFLMVAGIFPMLTGVGLLVVSTNLMKFVPPPDFLHPEYDVTSLMALGILSVIAPVVIGIIYILHCDFNAFNRIVTLCLIIFYIGCGIAAMVYGIQYLHRYEITVAPGTELENQWNMANHTQLEIIYGCCGWNQLPACCNIPSEAMKPTCCHATVNGCKAPPYGTTAPGICSEIITPLYTKLYSSVAIAAAIAGLVMIVIGSLLCYFLFESSNRDARVKDILCGCNCNFNCCGPVPHNPYKVPSDVRREPLLQHGYCNRHGCLLGHDRICPRQYCER